MKLLDHTHLCVDCSSQFQSEVDFTLAVAANPVHKRGRGSMKLLDHTRHYLDCFSQIEFGGRLYSTCCCQKRSYCS